MRKPMIWVDCDGVLADFVQSYLHVVRGLLNKVHTHADVTDWHFRECIVTPSEDRQVWRYIDNTPGFVHELADIPGAQLALATLRTLGPVGCLTSPHIGPHWVFERHNWLRARGFKKDEIVFASDKTHVPGVCLIDDKLENVEAWQAAHPGGVAILFDQPWNQGQTSVLRAHGWAEVVYAVRAACARAA